MTNQPEQPIKKSWKNKLAPVLETIEMVAMALVLYFLIDSVVARVRVQKISMVPTLMPGEVLLVNKLAYKLGEIEYGDIITFKYPIDPKLDYVKRVIGKPGDEVTIVNGEVTVNAQILYEPYISAAPEYEGVWKVPEDALFVLGDNRNPSSDSHVWGFVPLENVIGKAFAVYWPPNKIRSLPTPNIFAAQ
ncbi:MAG: signal peptidase I [Anaerolineaceae bacterium]|nr:signal peptidase I [Anaerolineaceae bacterium]